MTGCEDRGVRSVFTKNKERERETERIEIEGDIHREEEGKDERAEGSVMNWKKEENRMKRMKMFSQAQTSYTGLVQYVSCSTN